MNLTSLHSTVVALAFGISIAVAAPADATAAGVLEVDALGGADSPTCIPQVCYTGDDQRNTVTLTERGDDGRWLVGRDDAGTIVAGPGCTTVDAHEVRCRVTVGDQLYTVLRGMAGDDRMVIGPDEGVSSGEALGLVVLQGGDGNDILDGRNAAEAELFGGEGDDVLQGPLGSDARSWLVGGPGRDRVVGGRGRDHLGVDGDDIVVDAAAGDDSIEVDRPGSPTPILCGTGRDRVDPVIGTSRRPGPLLDRACERLVGFDPHPVRITRKAITFRLPCLAGEFEYADYRCHGRFEIRRGPRVLALRRFSAHNADRVRLTFRLTGELRRAVMKGTPLELSLKGFRHVESDFDVDEVGDYHWRVRALTSATSPGRSAG